MSWTDRLEQAQWRGIKFLTESHEASEGQRLAIHELPGGNVPVVQDLGAKARTWRVTAYFIGANYDIDRNKVLNALRTPGADWLRHPWLGRVWVRAQDWRTSESTAQGGYATITIEFVEGGAGTLQPAADVVDVAQGKVQAYQDTASALELAPMGPAAAQKFRVEVRDRVSALRNLLARARMPLTMAKAVLAEIDDALSLWGDAQDLAQDYAALMRRVAGTLRSGSDALLRSGAAPGAWLGSVGDPARQRVLEALAQGAPKASDVAYLGAVDNTLSGVDAQALSRNIWRERCARGHHLAACVADMALADYDTIDGRDAALARVLAAVDAAVALADMSGARLAADGLADQRFDAAMAARQAVTEALNAQALAPTQTRQIVTSLPAVVLAYRMGVDEDVLLARNRVRHPLFVKGVVRV